MTSRGPDHLRPEAVLRERLRRRAERFDADAAVVVTDEVLGGYLRGFEEPHGEGEDVVAADGPGVPG